MPFGEYTNTLEYLFISERMPMTINVKFAAVSESDTVPVVPVELLYSTRPHQYVRFAVVTERPVPPRVCPSVPLPIFEASRLGIFPAVRVGILATSKVPLVVFDAGRFGICVTSHVRVNAPSRAVSTSP